MSFLLQQLSQRPLKFLVVRGISRARALRSAACASMLRLYVAFVQLKVDALLCEHVSYRGQATGALAQDEGGQSPVLRHDDVARAGPVDYGQICFIRTVAYRHMLHAVLIACADVVVKRRHRYESVAVLLPQFAQYHHRTARAGVGVDEDSKKFVISYSGW